MSEQSSISNHLDKTIIRLFLIVFLISASVFAYRYTQYLPCKEVNFEIIANEYRVGKLINFKDRTHNANNWEWNFGDSTNVSITKEAIHVFEKPGEYKVRLTINNICETEQTITIKEKLFVLDSTKIPKFSVPNSIKLGEELTVKGELENGSTWEWRFGETKKVNSTEKNTTYTYKTPGLKTITLVANGDYKHLAKKQITVLPEEEEKKSFRVTVRPKRPAEASIKLYPEKVEKEEEKIPEKPKEVPYISENSFKVKLYQLAREDISPTAFSEYFCGDINKKIIANGKNTTFLIFAEKVKGRKLKVKELTLFRDKGSNCIKTITIKYNKPFRLF